MTMLDGFLILIGVTIVLLCTMEGLLRSFIMLLAFYFIITGAGMVTLGTEALRGIAVTLSRATGGAGAPNMVVTQAVAFAGLAIPLFIGAYILSKVVFPETTMPKLKWMDNVLGLLLGVVLALVVMAVIYGTWGAAVSVQWHNRQAWLNIRFLYRHARLRPLMGQVLAYFRPFLFLFAATEYPPFFFLH
jgi:hypothetical protein